MLLPITKNRNHLIDLLRFFAASGVALFHFNESIPFIDNWYRNFCKWGHWGVPVFFLISGYCIRIAEKHAITPKGFIIRRIFRIFPPYWFSLIIVCISVLILKIITGTNSVAILPKSFSDIIATVFLYTSPASHVKVINWVYWTLPYEVVFYLIIYLTFMLPRKIRSITLILLIAIAIILPIQKEGVWFFFDQLPTFMTGYALYLLINEDENVWLSLSILFLSIIGVVLKNPVWNNLLVVLGLCFLIFLDIIRPLKANIFSRFGDYSYSIYLLHVPICLYLLGFIKQVKIVQQNIILNIIIDFSLLILILIISKNS